MAVKSKKVNKADNSRLELYRLIGEGYKAMQDGRVSSVGEVRSRIEKRRTEGA